jgi:hypothetical protein
VPVKVCKDSGLRVEILSGLNDNDELISQITPAIAEGSVVKAERGAGGGAEKKESAE